MKRLIECVPNFSEGNDPTIIDRITAEIETVDGVWLLDVDPGKATNRTVVTFVGEPEAVIEAAVRCVRKASELIDMSKHSGEHPRFGATDVCPLVPISGVTMEETIEYARALAKRLGEEVGISVYCYESAALSPERKNLAVVRAGEYEGLSDRVETAEWKPDFGPAKFNAKSGATAVGARDFLIAYNVNLNTTSTRRANAIAFDVREKGRKKREGNPITGPVVKDANGKDVWIPGSLNCVKGIGWFIEEYGVAQISMNLTDISVTPLHIAFDEVCERARDRGIRVTGSELVGLVPKKSLLDAGEYFLNRQNRSVGIAEAEIMKIAVKSMGLDDLAPFDVREKVIEYVLEDREKKARLVDMSLEGFTLETASESVAPGGGSVAAAVGALGAALGTMVANLSAHKPGWDDRAPEFSEWAVQGKACHEELIRLVDADTDSFNAIMAAFRLPAGTDAEEADRHAAIQAATKGAIDVPFRVMEVCLQSFDLIEEMVRKGNPASVSDAAVGALCIRSAVMGAFMNVRINTRDLEDKALVQDYHERGAAIQEEAQRRERELLAEVDGVLNA